MAAPGALVANHASWLDIVALQSTAVPAFVSKSEVADWPGIGFIGRAIGTVFIARRAQEARAQTAQLEARLRTGDLLCIFPEGTSTDGQRVLPFKSTLFQVFLGADPAADLWVQPVSLRYRAPPGLPADFYGWWGSMDFAGHLRAVLAQSRGGEVAVIFHPPLRARDFPSRKALAQAAGAAVRAGFETAFSADGR
jgi:1-acyl-sn-glycerol-3-phosphate acyltransferase